MTMNANGSKLTLILTKERQQYQEQKRRYQHCKTVYTSMYQCLFTGNFLVHVQMHFVI